MAGQPARKLGWLALVLLFAVGGEGKEAQTKHVPDHHRRMASTTHPNQHAVQRHKAKALVAVMVGLNKPLTSSSCKYASSCPSKSGKCLN
jgi:hypothetical protein